MVRKITLLQGKGDNSLQSLTLGAVTCYTFLQTH